jgi:hypothetical protein
MTNILQKKNDIIFFKMDTIYTDGKPGELVDLNLCNIRKDLDIEFEFTKSFYINSKMRRGG